MLMNPLGNRLSRRQATRRVTQHCDQVLAPLDLRATQLSMLREIGRLGPIALDPLARGDGDGSGAGPGLDDPRSNT